MSRDSLELIRIKGALAALKANLTEKMKTCLQSVPFELRANGLGAGLSMLAAKKDDDSKKVAKMIASWLLSDCPHSPIRQTEGPFDTAHALAVIAGSSREQYRAASIEAQGYAIALKRLATGLVVKGNKDA